MLIHASTRSGIVSRVPGETQIVLTLEPSGMVSMLALFKGELDSAYAPMKDQRLLERELPKLLAELRHQSRDVSAPALEAK